MKKICYSFIFFAFVFSFADYTDITKKAISNSNALFELQKQAGLLEKQKREICNQIFETTKKLRKEIKDEDMKKYDEEYIKQMKKNIKDLNATDVFDEIGICLTVKPKMYQKSNGPFDGVPIKKKMQRQIRVATDEDNKTDDSSGN